MKAQVAELFQGHEDLLGEFGNFLPDPAAAKGGGLPKVSSRVKVSVKQMRKWLLTFTQHRSKGSKKKPQGSRMGLGAGMVPG